MVDLLALYDAELRTDPEVLGASTVRRIGPLWAATFGDDHLFVTYQDLDDPGARVADVAGLLAAEPAIATAEWKARSHDDAPGLEKALSAAGFVAGEAESVMLGEASALSEAPLPVGVTVRRLTAPAEMRAALDVQDAVFGGKQYAERLLAEILADQAAGGGIELWAAEVDGLFVSAGRITPIPGTAFAGIWGGATLPEYRGRGIYRALTAARVRSAMARGVRWIHSDSTEHSRPILERSGLVKVTETVPWEWERPARELR